MAIVASVRPRREGPHTGSTMTKTLHLGDPDVTWTLRQPKDVVLQISLAPPSTSRKTEPLRVAIRVAELGSARRGSCERARPIPALDRVAFEAEPNDTPETANALTLGQTVYGLADDRPYLPLPRRAHSMPEMTAGADWFTFTFESSSPKLAFFGLDFVDRDVAKNVRIYQKRDGKLVEYTRGIDPQSLQRERPPRLGANKFTTRVLTQGTYFVLVDACQPEYQLRTKLFDVPPYLKPEQAARG